MRLVTVTDSIGRTLSKRIRAAQSRGQRVKQVVLTEAEYAQLHEEQELPPKIPVTSTDEGVPVFVQVDAGVKGEKPVIVSAIDYMQRGNGE